MVEFPLNFSYYKHMRNTIIPIVATVVIYFTGWYGGASTASNAISITKDLEWKQKLIEADFAEYDRKTGIWHLREMQDVVNEGLLFGKAKSK